MLTPEQSRDKYDCLNSQAVAYIPDNRNGFFKGNGRTVPYPGR